MTSIVHIVDEDPSVRDSTSLLLDSHGYATRHYANGVELFRTPCVEGCVLLDLRAREAPGLQVLEQLAQYGASVPVIILTGHGEVITAVQALKLGVVDFIHKPYEEQELIAAIERAVAGLDPDDPWAEAQASATLSLIHI